MGKSKGQKRKTRKKLRKNIKKRGKFPTRKIIQNFPVGSKVAIVIDPSVMRGQPHPKFHGLTGTVSGKQGQAYEIEVRNGNAIKKVILRPEHLKMVME